MEFNNGNASKNVPERRKNPFFVDVKIGGGLGAVVLVGGVLATTALASAFFSRRRSEKRSGQAENEVFSVVDQSYDNVTREKEVNEGHTENRNTSPPPGIEIVEGKFGGVSSQPNVEFTGAMEKLENGDAECCIENVESHEDSIVDEALGTETSGDKPSNVSSLPNGPFIPIPTMVENGFGEEDYKLVAGSEINGSHTLDDVSAQLNKQLLCDKINTANNDSISSVETIDSLEDHILGDIHCNESNPILTPDLSAELNDIVYPTEKIQPLENRIQDEKPGTEIESIRLKLLYPSPEQVVNTDLKCYIESTQTFIQDEIPIYDVETINPRELESDQTKSTDASEERKLILLELVGKLREDRSIKDNDQKPEPENKYTTLFIANRRRMLIGAVSVATSLAISNLMGLPFLKLCLIMLLAGMLTEIHGT